MRPRLQSLLRRAAAVLDALAARLRVLSGQTAARNARSHDGALARLRLLYPDAPEHWLAILAERTAGAIITMTSHRPSQTAPQGSSDATRTPATAAWSTASGIVSTRHER